MVILGFLNLEYYTGQKHYVWHYRHIILKPKMCFDSPHPSNFTQNANAHVCSTKGLLILCIRYILAHRTIAGPCLILSVNIHLFFTKIWPNKLLSVVCVCTKNSKPFYTHIWNCISFFHHPSSCPNYCLLKSWIVGSVAASPSACQCVGLQHHGNGCSLVLCDHHWVQIWYTQLHVPTEWWVSS